MRHKTLSFRGKLALATALSVLALNSQPILANAQNQVDLSQVQNVEIPAGSVLSAIQSISETYGIAVIASDEIVRGKQSNGVSGDYKAADALNRVLSGTGLFAAEAGNGNFVVKVAEASTEETDDQRRPIINSDSQPAEESLIVDTVIVTGQQIDRTLQDTKESVAVITAEDIELRSLFDIEDVVLQTPNVAATLDGSFNVTIRGVSRLPFATGGTGDNSTTFYDDVAITNNAVRFISQNLWDLEQIEVLRGPQSTNVGRNALIGATVIRTNNPQLDEFEAAGRVEAGNFDTYAFEGMVNMPLASNTALRITGERSETDGFIDNVTLGTDDTGKTEFTTFRAKLLTDVSENFRAITSLQYVEGEIGSRFFIADADGPLDTFVTTTNIPELFTYKGTTGSLNLTYDLSDHWTIQSISAFSDGDFTRLTDGDAGPANGGFSEDDSTQFNVSQELRVSYNSERLRGVVGAYFLQDQFDSTFVTDVSVSPIDAGIPASLAPFYPPILSLVDIDESDRETSNYALFTQWQFDATDVLQISAGLRFDQESFDLSSVGETVTDLSVLPDPIEAGALAEMQQPGSGPAVIGGITGVNAFLASFVSPPFEQNVDASFEAFLPEFGLTYKVSENINASAFYKRGYRAGGAEIVLGELNEFDPEFIDNFEVSLRSEWLESALVLNANAYYGIWVDQQLNVPIENNPSITFTENAGESTIWGFEVEADYAATDRTQFFAGVGYAQTEFDEFCSINSTVDELPDCSLNGVDGKDLSGNDFAVSPNWTASLGGQHYLTNQLYAQANATYQSGSFSNVENVSRLKTDDFVLANASLGYEGEGFDIRLYVRNVFDTSYQLRLTDFRGRLGVITGTPREYGVIVSAQF